jgi:hypothetical protein
MRLTLLVKRLQINWAAALYAGVAAGILATMAQIILWWAIADSLPGVMFRDARLAAAIILGQEILPMTADFDWLAMFVATMVHFSLSVVYSTILALLIAPFNMAVSILIGIVFGFILFGVNMYGFTIIFPWFVEARDWNTLVAHIVLSMR